MKTWKKIIIIFASVVLIGTIGCGIYISDYYHATDEVFESIENNDDSVKVVEIEGQQIIFAPQNKPKAGLIFYPGGKVQYESYAPLMEAFAKEGILSIVVHMPGNLAVLDIDAAEGIKEQYLDIEKWYIGGHSLGGVMAASYVSEHASEYEGLLLLAAYSTVNLSDSGLNIISLYGSEDKVLKMDSYEENKNNLPEDFVEVVIEGGCHSGFAYYGEQDGDGTPIITQEEQIEKTVEVFLENIIL